MRQVLTACFGKFDNVVVQIPLQTVRYELVASSRMTA